jgi:hypothetical protein
VGKLTSGDMDRNVTLVLCMNDTGHIPHLFILRKETVD